MSQRSDFVQPLASWKQLKNRLRLSPALVSIGFVLILFYFITALLHVHHNTHVLEFTPADTLTGSLWQPFTAGFADNYFLCLVLHLAVLYGTNKILESVWGTVEYLKFVGIVNVSTYLLNLSIYFIGYVAIREEKFLYAPFSGSHGLIAGILVGVKQLVPDHVIVHGFPMLRVRHLPISFFLFAFVTTLLKVTSTRYLTVIMGGLTSSWIYLRYFQVRDSGRGDFSEALSFASFFPESTQPHIMRYSTVVYNAVDGLLKKRHSIKTIDIKNLSSNVYTSDPASERRRQIALQALNERLKQTDDVDWPSSSDEDENAETAESTENNV